MKTPTSDAAAFLEQLLNPRQEAMRMRREGVPEPEMVQQIMKMLMDNPGMLNAEQMRDDVHQEQQMFENGSYGGDE